MAAGKIYPSEKQSLTCPHTGAAITQYASVGDVNHVLYFTNPSYTAGDEQVVFLSDRAGHLDLHLVDRASGRIVQLSDGDNASDWNATQSASRGEAYYTDGRVITRVRYDTLKRDVIFEAPDNMRISMLSANAAPWLAFSVSEISRFGSATGLTETGRMRERFYMRPLTLIYRLNVDTTEAECVWGDYKCLTHVQLSPADKDLLIFSDWKGYGSPRVWYHDLSSLPLSTPRPLCPEGEHARGGHEAFTRRGNLYLQWMEGDLRPGREHQLFHGFQQLRGVPAGRAHEATFKRYAIPEQGDSLVHHFMMSEDETWGLHDRWLGAPTWEDNLNFMAVFRHCDDEPQTRVERVCFFNGHWELQQPGAIGPNPSLTSDDRFAAYTSYVGERQSVCEVDLRPFVEKLLSAR